MDDSCPVCESYFRVYGTLCPGIPGESTVLTRKCGHDVSIDPRHLEKMEAISEGKIALVKDFHIHSKEFAKDCSRMWVQLRPTVTSRALDISELERHYGGKGRLIPDDEYEIVIFV
jgi:hypothetical protein